MIYVRQGFYVTYTISPWHLSMQDLSTWTKGFLGWSQSSIFRAALRGARHFFRLCLFQIIFPSCPCFFHALWSPSFDSRQTFVKDLLCRKLGCKYAGAMWDRYTRVDAEVCCGLPVLRPAVTAMNTHDTGDNRHQYDISQQWLSLRFSLRVYTTTQHDGVLT